MTLMKLCLKLSSALRELVVPVNVAAESRDKENH
jgi:hypothetical protein